MYKTGHANIKMKMHQETGGFFCERSKHCEHGGLLGSKKHSDVLIQNELYF